MIGEHWAAEMNGCNQVIDAGQGKEYGWLLEEELGASPLQLRWKDNRWLPPDPAPLDGDDSKPSDNLRLSSENPQNEQLVLKIQPRKRGYLREVAGAHCSKHISML